jgi:hypothetical protein
MLMAGQKVKREDAIQQAAVKPDARLPVEVFKSTDILESGLLKAYFHVMVITAVYLVCQDYLQENSIVQLITACQRHAFGQGIKHSTQLKPLEQRL